MNDIDRRLANRIKKTETAIAGMTDEITDLKNNTGGNTGIPDGGTTGQVLTKASDDNQDVTWGTVGTSPDVPIAVDHQEVTSDTTVGNQRIMRGWGYIRGGGATQATIAITFKDAFDDIPTIITESIDAAKAYSSGAPTSPADTPAGANSTHVNANYYNPSTTGFTLQLWRSSNLLNTYYYLFSWIAIGTKSRS